MAAPIERNFEVTGFSTNENLNEIKIKITDNDGNEKLCRITYYKAGFSQESAKNDPAFISRVNKLVDLYRAVSNAEAAAGRESKNIEINQKADGKTRVFINNNEHKLKELKTKYAQDQTSATSPKQQILQNTITAIEQYKTTKFPSSTRPPESATDEMRLSASPAPAPVLTPEQSQRKRVSDFEDKVIRLAAKLTKNEKINREFANESFCLVDDFLSEHFTDSDYHYCLPDLRKIVEAAKTYIDKTPGFDDQISRKFQEFLDSPEEVLLLSDDPSYTAKKDFLPLFEKVKDHPSLSSVASLITKYDSTDAETKNKYAEDLKSLAQDTYTQLGRDHPIKKLFKGSDYDKNKAIVDKFLRPDKYTPQQIAIDYYASMIKKADNSPYSLSVITDLIASLSDNNFVNLTDDAKTSLKAIIADRAKVHLKNVNNPSILTQIKHALSTESKKRFDSKIATIKSFLPPVEDAMEPELDDEDPLLTNSPTASSGDVNPVDKTQPVPEDIQQLIDELNDDSAPQPEDIEFEKVLAELEATKKTEASLEKEKHLAFIINEIISTEQSFFTQVETFYQILTMLIEMRDSDEVRRNYYNTLTIQMNSFRNFNNKLSQLKDLELENKADEISKLYVSDIFTNYTNALREMTLLHNEFTENENAKTTEKRWDNAAVTSAKEKEERVEKKESAKKNRKQIEMFTSANSDPIFFVQRLPRHILLQTEMIRSTPQHPIQGLDIALEQTKSKAKIINEEQANKEFSSELNKIKSIKTPEQVHYLLQLYNGATSKELKNKHKEEILALARKFDIKKTPQAIRMKIQDELKLANALDKATSKKPVSFSPDNRITALNTKVKDVDTELKKLKQGLLSLTEKEPSEQAKSIPAIISLNLEHISQFKAELISIDKLETSDKLDQYLKLFNSETYKNYQSFLNSIQNSLGNDNELKTSISDLLTELENLAALSQANACNEIINRVDWSSSSPQKKMTIELLVKMTNLSHVDALDDDLVNAGVISQENLLYSFLTIKDSSISFMFECINTILAMNEFDKEVKDRVYQFAFKIVESGLYDNQLIGIDLQLNNINDTQQKQFSIIKNAINLRQTIKNTAKVQSEGAKDPAQQQNVSAENNKKILEQQDTAIQELTELCRANDYDSFAGQIHSVFVNDQLNTDILDFTQPSNPTSLIKLQAQHINSLSNLPAALIFKRIEKAIIKDKNNNDIIDPQQKKELKEDLAKIYNFFTKVLDKCMDEGNYNAAYALASGLSNPDITRLQINNDKAKKVGGLVNNQFSQLSSFANYRKLLLLNEGKPVVALTAIDAKDIEAIKADVPMISANGNYNIARLNILSKIVQLQEQRKTQLLRKKISQPTNLFDKLEILPILPSTGNKSTNFFSKLVKPPKPQ